MGSMKTRVGFVLLWIGIFLGVSLFAQEEPVDPPAPDDPALVKTVCRDATTGRFVPCPAPPVHHDEVPPLAPLLVPAPRPEPPSISVVAGGQVLLTSGEEEKPFKAMGRIIVDWPLAGTRRPMGALVVAEITALPGAELSLGDSASFNAVEFSGAVWYNPIPKFYGSFYCEGGFASAYSDAVGPSTNAPLWAGCGVYFEDAGTKLGRLKLGLGPDERAGYGWAMSIQVMGQLRLIEYESLGATLTLRAILPLEVDPRTGQRTTVVTAGAGISWDSKKGGT